MDLWIEFYYIFIHYALSEKWAAGVMGCRNNGSTEQWAVGAMVCTHYQWVKLEKNHFGFSEDIYICCVYYPPSCSAYTQKILILEITFTNYRENIIKQENKHIVNIRSHY